MFRGTSAAQDARFQDKHSKLMKLATTNSSPELLVKIDMDKVTKSVINQWISARLTELLHGFEDDITIGMVQNLLDKKHPTAAEISVILKPILGPKTEEFTLELWKLLTSAQSTPQGVPKEWLHSKEKSRDSSSQHPQKRDFDRNRSRHHDRNRNDDYDRSRPREYRDSEYRRGRDRSPRRNRSPYRHHSRSRSRSPNRPSSSKPKVDEFGREIVDSK